MRRLVIRKFLPLVFCTFPVLAAGLIFFALPPTAREFFTSRLTPLDLLILLLGSSIFAVQMLLAWLALRWRGLSFDERPDPWLGNLAQAAEWFPLLGLIGTVAGIMQTFAAFGKEEGEVVTQAEVIAKYAPAITATLSGLFMALINILPTWVVMIGRGLILSLSGEEPKPRSADGAPSVDGDDQTASRSGRAKTSRSS